jgi:hypothetical protein
MATPPENAKGWRQNNRFTTDGENRGDYHLTNSVEQEESASRLVEPRD